LVESPAQLHNTKFIPQLIDESSARLHNIQFMTQSIGRIISSTT